MTSAVLPHKWQTNHYCTATTTSSTTNSNLPPPGMSSIPDASPPSTPQVEIFGFTQYNQYEESMDPTGWWLTEEQPGVRAYWDGNKQFQFISGALVEPPEFFVKGMPNTPLDGQLWVEGGLTEGSLVNSKEPSETEVVWKKLNFLVFDAPNQTTPIEERISYLKTLEWPSHAKVLDLAKCESAEQLKNLREEITKKGADGILLRKPQSLYEGGKTANFYKLKRKLGGTIVCELPNGTKFTLSVKDRELPPIGSVVTFRHNGYDDKSAEPKEPQFMHMRADLNWDNVLEKEYPFYLAFGKSRGLPKCFGCKQTLRDRKRIRVLVKSSYTPQNTKQPHPTIFTFCPRASCIHKAIEQNNSNAIGAYIPPFNGTIYLPPEMKHATTEDLGVAENVKFVRG